MHDVIIIGAGPSGLSLAAQLKKLGQDSLILDKGDRVAQTWKDMPQYLHLVSPPASNALLKEEFLKSPRLKRLKASDYWTYLDSFSHKYKLNIQLKTLVYCVEKHREEFHIKTSKGEFIARNLIWATGYFSNPQIQKFFSGDHQLPILHTSSIKNIEELTSADISKVLIVGKRLSAGQIIDQLELANISYDISARSPIKYMANGFLFNLFFRFMTQIEYLLLKLSPNNKKEVDVKMESIILSQRIKEKKTLLFPKVQSINRKKVTFTNKKIAQYDAIILATGFLPQFKALENLTNIPDFSKLEKNFQHPEVENLFFLGFSLQVNFRSRFIRGIREDANILAKMIISQL